MATQEAEPKSLVLVLGAGASREVNLPTGAELKQTIASLLDIRFQHGSRQESGDEAITQALRQIASTRDLGRGDINPLLHVCWRIRDAMPQAMSIDNFIDSHRGIEDIATCGKLAITQAILSAEAGSNLAVDPSNIYNKLDFSATANTWFPAFFQLLTENAQVGELPGRLRQVAVINFNYDRCFEHYLHLALQNYYGLSAAEATELASQVEVHHPYGKVGPLPWMTTNQSEASPYGSRPAPQKLISLSGSLRTFTEGTDPSVSHIESIRSVIALGKRLAFLGFAYHRLNLRLLFDDLPAGVERHTRAIYGTGVGLSQSDIQLIENELAAPAGQAVEQTHIRRDLSCGALFHEYWRSLSLA